MATAMTFDSLQQLVRDYLERGSAVDPIVYEQLPTLINLAERRIADDLKTLGFKIPVTSNFTNGVAVYAVPDRWRQTASINFGTGTGNNTRNPLYPRSYEYLREFHPDDTVTGVPRFYAPYDNEHFIVAPTPAADYPFEMLYYELPPLLDASNQQNWLTEYQPNLLLFATLLQCTEFLKNDERIPVWQAEYQNRVDTLNGNDRKRMADQSTARTGA